MNRTSWKIDIHRKFQMEAHGSYLISAVCFSHFSQMGFFPSHSFNGECEWGVWMKIEREEKNKATVVKRTLDSVYACILYEVAFFGCRSKKKLFQATNKNSLSKFRNTQRDAVQHWQDAACVKYIQPHCLHFWHSAGVFLCECVCVCLCLCVYVFYWLRFFDFDGFY